MRLTARHSEILTAFPPKGSFKLLKNIKYLCRKVKWFQKLIWPPSGQILRAWARCNIARYRHSKIVCCQTAEHSLEWTKCPAGRNFHQNATESFLETYREYKILNMRYRNVKPFQKLFGTIFPNILKYILPGCRLPVRSQMDQMPYSQEFLPKLHWKLLTNLLSIFDVKNILKHIKNLLCASSENLSTKSTTFLFGIARHFWTKIWHTLEVSRHHLVALRWKFLTAGL